MRADADDAPVPCCRLQGTVPAPLLLGGDMLVGAIPGASWGLQPQELTVFRSVSASVSSDRQ